MAEFFDALVSYDFLQRAVLTGVLASVACGVVGSYVVTRRVTYAAGGIAHAVLGGIGAAVYVRSVHGWTAVTPMAGALVAALAAALIISWISARGSERTDTVIGAVWALGMAAGVLFIASTPGYAADLMSYLFGNILMVSTRDLWFLGALDAIVLVAAVMVHHRLVASSYDEEFARARGIPVDLLQTVLLVLTALTVVMLVSVVGVVMMIAILTLPAAIAGRFTNRVSHMIVVAAAVTVALTSGGLALSYAPGLPSGATIVALTGVSYLVVVALTRRPA